MILLDQHPLVTVIVPVYKVEKYLEKCVDSILNQTYSSLEIILVDDGSPDNCGALCDNYAINDERIIVIHQENQGLSEARNAAIDIASGEYITFVDSDDWIDICFIENLLSLLIREKAQIAVTSLLNVFEDGSTQKNTNESSLIKLNKIEALSCYLFNGYLTPCACGKLYKKELWNNIRFPKGKLFEDQFTIYKVLEKAETVIFSPKDLYFYLKRNGSIGHSTFSSKTIDLHEGINMQYDYLTNQYPSINKDLSIGKIIWELVFINILIFNNKENEYQKLLSELKFFIFRNIFNAITSTKIPFVRKIQIALFSISFPLYKKIYLFLKRKGRIA